MELEWRDGKVPVSTQFQDPYYSFYDGLAESQHTYLAGNNLPERFHDGFHVAELGFGTGLNLLATLQAWRNSNQKGVLRFTSFEAYPLTGAEMVRALENFPELADFLKELTPQLGQAEIKTDDLDFQMVHGDARKTLAQWESAADAWFLDGFSPAKNPELWGSDLMGEVGKHTAPNGTCATYTAARFVREGLADAGFDIKRIKGFSRKRHMIQGQLK